MRMQVYMCVHVYVCVLYVANKTNHSSHGYRSTSLFGYSINPNNNPEIYYNNGVIITINDSDDNSINK